MDSSSEGESIFLNQNTFRMDQSYDTDSALEAVLFLEDVEVDNDKLNINKTHIDNQDNRIEITRITG